jgi:hypothetical protein
MKKYELDALRDFAIEHLPAAQRQREKAQRFGMDLVGYCQALAVAAMLTQASATISAIESRAARLLEQLMLLALDHGYEGIENTISKAAHELASLTCTTIPWLPTPQDEPSIEPKAQPKVETETEPAQRLTRRHNISIADLVPGDMLTTEQAASALGRKPNTLRTWASKQTGDIQPAFQIGREHRWRADDILALANAKELKRK